MQTVAALAIVALTVLAFVWRAWARRQRPGCGGDCGCPAQKLQESVRHIS